MTRYSRIAIALFILLSGLALIPQVGIFAGVVSWQRFAGAYEDVVTITRARYHNGELRMRAISSAGGDATLTVYRTSDNAYIGTLQFEGEDHRGEFNVSDPHVVTVRSSLGGWATVLTWDESDPPITVTASPQPPTSTPDPNATSTPTNVPSSTPQPGATETPTTGPSATPDPNATSTPTSEPSATPDPNVTSTPTSEPSATPDPDATATPTTEPGATETPTPTNTPEGGPQDPNSPGTTRPLYLPLVMQ